MVGGPCRRRPLAPDVECGSALPGRRNENAPERRSHVHGHGRVIYVASGRHRTGHRSCMLLCKLQKTVGRFQGWGRPCSGICSRYFAGRLASCLTVRPRELVSRKGMLCFVRMCVFFTHSFHQQNYTHAPHSGTSKGKLETKLGPVSCTLYHTQYTTNHFSFLFLITEKFLSDVQSTN